MDLRKFLMSCCHFFLFSHTKKCTLFPKDLGAPPTNLGPWARANLHHSNTTYCKYLTLINLVLVQSASSHVFTQCSQLFNLFYCCHFVNNAVIISLVVTKPYIHIACVCWGLHAPVSYTRSLSFAVCPAWGCE